MRVAAIGDAHLGRSYLPVTTPRVLNQREVDFEQAFSDAVDVALAEAPDVVVWLGDIFDHPATDLPVVPHRPARADAHPRARRARRRHQRQPRHAAPARHRLALLGAGRHVPRDALRPPAAVRALRAARARRARGTADAHGRGHGRGARRGRPCPQPRPHQPAPHPPPHQVGRARARRHQRDRGRRPRCCVPTSCSSATTTSTSRSPRASGTRGPPTPSPSPTTPRRPRASSCSTPTPASAVTCPSRGRRPLVTLESVYALGLSPAEVQAQVMERVATVRAAARWPACSSTGSIPAPTACSTSRPCARRAPPRCT